MSSSTPAGRLSWSDPGFRTFLLIWAGQVVSLVGSGLTSFVLGVWVYQSTGSATQFALIAASATIPGVLLSPLAGEVVDRHDRRRVMIAADCGAALSTLVVFALYLNGALEVWHIYAAAAATAVCNTFQGPAYAASIPLLVPREQLGRVNGLVQIERAAGIISPALAAALIATIGVSGVIMVDFATFLFATGTLLLVRIPRPAATAHGAAASRGSLLARAGYGWRYLRERNGLMWLVVLLGVTNFFIGMASVMVQPLILSFSSVGTLGKLMLAGGSGMLAGGMIMGAWGGPKRRIHGVLAFMFLGGIALFLHGLAPSALLIAFVAPAFLFTIPITSGSTMAILQARVPADVQGRVFAAVRVLAMAAVPLAYLVAGPAADYVFEPLMAPGGALAGSVGSMIGTGDGRGIALMFMVSGLVASTAAVLGYLNPHLRRVEDEETEPEPVRVAAPAAAGVGLAG
jgi:DHA3 family macrolide efflux protein-like MFS transporter